MVLALAIGATVKTLPLQHGTFFVANLEVLADEEEIIYVKDCLGLTNDCLFRCPNCNTLIVGDPLIGNTRGPMGSVACICGYNKTGY